MAEREILRGKVLSYPAEKDKGLVEVSIGAYAKDGDTVYARVEQSMSGVYWLPEIGESSTSTMSPKIGRASCRERVCQYV